MLDVIDSHKQISNCDEKKNLQNKKVDVQFA